MDRRIKVGTLQINNVKGNSYYIPLSIGYLLAYARKYTQNIDCFEFLSPVYERVLVQDGVEQLQGSDIVFCSTYQWNVNLSLAIIRQLKHLKPQTTVVLGGPQIPAKAEGFLQNHRDVDVVCHGEGEQVFASILDNFITGEWEKVPSISYINTHGQFVRTPKAKRKEDLSEIPSPFLHGIFDSLIAKNPKRSWIGLWETNRGCPFSCSFCDWGSATASRVYRFDMDRLFKDMDWFSKNKIEYVYCCDANFGLFPRDLEIVQYVAENKKKYGYPQAFAVQNAKNSSEKSYQIHKVLAENGLSGGVAVAMQSMNMESLVSIKRSNIRLRDFQELQKRMTDIGINSYTEIIMGLPNETYDTYVDGVSTLIENGQHSRIMFYPVTILPGAEMADPEYQKKFGLVVQEVALTFAHENLDTIHEIVESQTYVIATNTMSKPDWVRVRAFSWMVGLIYFDKLLQVPILLLHAIFSIPIRQLLEVFMREDPSFPMLSEIRAFFLKVATDLQNGGEEFCPSKRWLNIRWTADELVFMNFCGDGKLSLFHEEVERLLNQFLQEKNKQDYSSLVHEAIKLNKNLIKLPFQNGRLQLKLSYNLWEVYQSALRSNPIPLVEGDYHYLIDRETEQWQSWEEWCKEIVWYGGHKKGRFLYSCFRNNEDLAPEAHGFSKISEAGSRI